MKATRIQKIVAVIGALGFVTPALAVNSNNHGAAFHAYNASETLDIDYLAFGARNLAASARYVIAPLVRSPTSDGSLSVYVDGLHYGNQTTYCTLYSYNYTGAFLGAQSFIVTQNGGTFDRFMSLPAGQAPSYAYASVLCNIASNGQAVMLGVDVVQ